ncbi:B3 domain-containing protein, partial [Trifolium pratense]
TYFPPISQPEGVPLKILDAKGKEWIFQFRFWPNNNSRMYVLEGVTPCIQSMQLQAGDTAEWALGSEGIVDWAYNPLYYQLE